MVLLLPSVLVTMAFRPVTKVRRGEGRVLEYNGAADYQRLEIEGFLHIEVRWVNSTTAELGTFFNPHQVARSPAKSQT